METVNFKSDDNQFARIRDDATNDGNLRTLLLAFQSPPNVLYCVRNNMGVKLEEAFSQTEENKTRKMISNCLIKMITVGNYVLSNSEQFAMAYAKENDTAMRQLLLVNLARVPEESPALDMMVEKILKGDGTWTKNKKKIKGDYEILLRLLGPLDFWTNKKVVTWLKATGNFTPVEKIFEEQNVTGRHLKEAESKQVEGYLKALGGKGKIMSRNITKARDSCLKHLGDLKNAYLEKSRKVEDIRGALKGVGGGVNAFAESYKSFSVAVSAKAAPQAAQSSDMKAGQYDAVKLPQLDDLIYGFFTAFNSDLPTVMAVADDYFGEQDCETKWDAKQAALQVQITLAAGYCGMLLYFFQHKTQGNLGVRVCRNEGEGLYVYRVANELKQLWDAKDLLVKSEEASDEIVEPSMLPEPSPDTVPETKELNPEIAEALSKELGNFEPGSIELTAQICADNIAGFKDAVTQMQKDLGPEDTRNDRYLKKVCRENAIMFSRSLSSDANKKILADSGEKLADSLVAVWKQYQDDYTITLKATDVLKELKQSGAISEDCMKTLKGLANSVRSRWTKGSPGPYSFPSEKISKNLEELC